MRSRTIAIGYSVIAAWTLWPVCVALLTGAVGFVCFGVVLDESNPKPCLVLGCDVGGLLYAMGMMGWFSLLTFPTGFIGLVVFTIVVVLQKWRERRNRRSECQQEVPPYR